MLHYFYLLSDQFKMYLCNSKSATSVVTFTFNILKVHFQRTLFSSCVPLVIFVRFWSSRVIIWQPRRSKTLFGVKFSKIDVVFDIPLHESINSNLKFSYECIQYYFKSLTIDQIKIELAETLKIEFILHKYDYA